MSGVDWFLVTAVAAIFTAPSIIGYAIWKYRRDRHIIISALREGRVIRGLELVRIYKVGRSNVYIVLSDLERRGHVQRVGSTAPYYYKWRDR